MADQTVYGPYSPLKQADNFVFVSGQVGIDPATGQAPRGIAAQTAQALSNMLSLLQAEELAMGDVVKTTVFLRSIDDFKAMNDVYVESFPEPRPARSCVAVASLPQLGDTELLVEIEAVAFKKNAGRN